MERTDDFRFRFVDLLLLFEDDGVERRLGIFLPFRIQIDDAFLVADAGNFRGRVVHLLLLLRDLLVHAHDGAIHDLFLFLDARVLINGHDLVGDVGCFLRIGAQDADLKQVGVADFIDIELGAQALISLLARRANTVAAHLSCNFRSSITG